MKTVEDYHTNILAMIKANIDIGKYASPEEYEEQLMFCAMLLRAGIRLTLDKTDMDYAGLEQLIETIKNEITEDVEGVTPTENEPLMPPGTTVH